MAPRVWTDERLKQIAELRDVHKMRWAAIGERFGVDKSICCARYHAYKSKLRVEALRAKMVAAAPPPRVPPAIEPATPLAATAEPVARPRYFHYADADLKARIARQGLTAGLFGDPPPGRSALDQRQGCK